MRDKQKQTELGGIV